MQIIVGGDEYDAIKSPNDLGEIKPLKEYEFYLKIRNKPLVSFKSPNMLIKEKTYSLSKSEEKRLDAYFLEKYYKPIPSQNKMRKNIETSEETPPFDLYLGENDK